MRYRVFDILLPLIPILAVAGAVPLTIAQIVLAISIISLVVLRHAASTWRVRAKQWWPVMALVVWAGVGMVWALDPARAGMLWLRMVSMGALGVLGLHALQTSPRYPRRMVLAFLAAYVACAVALASEVLPQGGIVKLLSELFGGNYERYIHKTVNRSVCAMAVLVWPVMYLLYVRGKQGVAWLLLALAALPVVALESMSAQLGLLAGLGCFLYCRYVPLRYTRALACVVPVVFFMLPFAVDALLPSQVLAPYKAEINQATSGRLPIWEALGEKSAEKPALGWGMGSSPSMPLSRATLDGMKLDHPPLHPHFSALQLKLELGTVGLALVALSIGLVMLSIARMALVRPHMALAMATVAAYLGAGLSSFSVWQQWWVATGWLAAMIWVRFTRLKAVA